MPRRRLRSAALVALALLAVLLLPAVGAAVAAPRAFASFHVPGPPRAVPPAGAPVHDPRLPTAVIVVGEDGAVVSDVLAPYQLLAETGRFNVHVVADRRVPVPLSGGLDLVPDLTFAELASRTGRPDLVVVPALPDERGRAAVAVAGWVREQAARGATLLSVCNGAGVLAAAGLLDGRPAAAHWTRIGRFEGRYPAVDWTPGRRYVDDGDVVTTAGILSGVDGTLHLVERLAGADAADRAAAAVGWPHRGATPPVHEASGVPAPVAIVNAAYRWDADTVGVVLAPDVGEMELASVFDTVTQSLTARTLAVGEDGPVRSRHGLTFLPRADLTVAAPQLDRLVVPGAGAVAPRTTAPGLPRAELLHRRPGFGYDVVIDDLARHSDTTTARWTAAILELPARPLPPDRPAWPRGPTLLLVGLLVPGTVVVAVVAAAHRRSRRG